MNPFPSSIDAIVRFVFAFGILAAFAGVHPNVWWQVLMINIASRINHGDDNAFTPW